MEGGGEITVDWIHFKMLALSELCFDVSRNILATIKSESNNGCKNIEEAGEIRFTADH